jgi:WhiB family redox-sensing transcriptional regulator
MKNDGSPNPTGSIDWMDNVSCKGVDTKVFFPSEAAGVEAAQLVCAQCIVRIECLEYALSNRIDYGVWGGTSKRERNRILKQRQEG